MAPFRAHGRPIEHHALESSIGPAIERRNEHRALGGRPTRILGERRSPDERIGLAYVICRAADTVIRQG
jgi:hypothetical protein